MRDRFSWLASLFCITAGLLVVTLINSALAGGASDSPPRSESRVVEADSLSLWRGVNRQMFDFSCGAGAVANLVMLLGGTRISETELLHTYEKEHSEKECLQVMREGFSLLDLKRMLDSLGIESAGVRYERGTLPEQNSPMIVHLFIKGSKHFAVFVGFEHDSVLLLDSARGRMRLSVERFLDEWDGTALLVIADQGRRNFLSIDKGLSPEDKPVRTPELLSGDP